MRYIGITFGPIDRVISWTKSTMSIWAASYFFSDLARQIIQPLVETLIETEDDIVSITHRFLKPVITEEMKSPNQGVVGLFPDQYIFEANDSDTITSIRQHCDDVLNNIGTKMSKVLEEDAVAVQNYIKRTIKVYIVELNVENNAKEDEIIAQMHTLMANAECRDVFPPKFDGQKGGYLERLFRLEVPSDDMQKVNKWKWLSDYFGLKLESFDSIPDVAYKNYVTFISADGDHFGDMVKRDKQASIIISNFSRWMRDIITKYGGQVIYQGGDDISFYAPLIGKDSEIDNYDSHHRTYKSTERDIDIFGLTKKIDQALEDAYSAAINNNPVLEANLKGCVPTISYGIAMAYEKYPMAETRAKAHTLEVKAKNSGRNAICWELKKHSGHTSAHIIKKASSKLYDKTLNLIDWSLQSRNWNNSSDEFLHSVTYFLERHKVMLKYILAQDKKNADSMMKMYLKNNFNECEHAEYDNFFDDLKNIMMEARWPSIVTISGNSKENSLTMSEDEAIGYLQALLRYVHHLLRK